MATAPSDSATAPLRRRHAGVAAAPHYDPARAGGERADAERGADGIDHQQHEDDAETSERGTGEVGAHKASRRHMAGASTTA